MTLYKWHGILLRIGDALATSEECCCGTPDCIGCPGTGPSLTATVESEACPEIDKFSWELTGPAGGPWEGTIPSPETTFLLGKLTVRCNGDTDSADDYEVLPELGTVPAECAVSPYDVWVRPDTAQCDPFRLTLEMQVIQLDPEVPCDVCDNSPGPFTIVITETPPPRTNVRRAHTTVSLPMKQQGHTLLSARKSPGTFLNAFMRVHYPRKTGCMNDYRALDSYPSEWWESQHNLEWLRHRLAMATALRKIPNTQTAPHTISRLVRIMSHLAKVPKQQFV